MKQFESGFLNEEIAAQGLDKVSAFMDRQRRQNIDYVFWGKTGYKPEVSFSMLHDQNGIYLKYWVREKYIRSIYKRFNDPVYKDSCVECFIAFESDTGYYNMEFNCAGTALIGYGADKYNRQLLPENVLSKITVRSNIQPYNLVNELYSWDLTLFFPFETFIHHQLTGMTGHLCRANFYKCGDDLPEPHFLSWAPIVNPYPEFHLPAFFGTIGFV